MFCWMLTSDLETGGARCARRPYTHAHRTFRRFARKLYDRPEAFASEMPCAPAARWLAHSVRAWRQGAHVDTTAACLPPVKTCHKWGLLTASVLVPFLHKGLDQDFCEFSTATAL